MSGAAKRPTIVLRSIAIFEGVKGMLALAAVCGLLSLRHTDLQAAAEAFLVRHHINPERHYVRLFVDSIAKATHHDFALVATMVLAYAVLRLAEGYGLWKGRPWAEWLAVVSAGIYLPLEVEHLARRPSWLNLAIVVFNILLIVYLAKMLMNQRAARIRTHHHHHQPAHEDPSPTEQ